MKSIRSRKHWRLLQENEQFHSCCCEKEEENRLTNVIVRKFRLENLKEQLAKEVKQDEY